LLSAVLAEADVDERMALYTSLGLELVYAPGERRVDVTSTPIGVDIRACRRTVRNAEYKSRSAAAMVHCRQGRRSVSGPAMG
jgi:hypothetical protein